MELVQVKLVTPSERSKNFVHKVIGRLSSSKHQVSIESQQLSSVGMMPDPNYQVIDIAKMSIAQAIRLYEDAKNHTGGNSKYVIIADGEKETVQERIDREQFTRSLSDLGATVITSEAEMADDIQEKYKQMGINVSESK